MRNRKSHPKNKSNRAHVGIEFLEDRRLLSAALTVAESLMVFNAVKNSSASPAETLTLTNTGDQPLSLNGLSVVNDPSQTNQGAARFTLLNTTSAPSSLSPGGSFALQIVYSATAVGLDYALLDINTSDPVHPLQQVQLHGIGTAGLGGGNQPSLELILQAYDQTNYANVGESNEASAYYPEPPAAGSDEVNMQELVKAGTGPVTINVLASFTAASTKPYTLGWYSPSNPTNSLQQLFYTPTSEYQSTYVQPQGVTSFDPGSSVFGFYNPSATVKVNNALVTGYTQDDLNTWDTTDPRKFRFFPLLNASGVAVPNSYIMTSTEWYNPSGYDFTNLVAIVSNVTAAPSAPAGPVLSVTNPVALPGSNTLIFNRIQNQNTSVGDTVHDTNTITLENTGAGNLIISNITVAATTTASNNATQYQLVNPPTLPLTLTPGETQTVEVQFVLSQTDANSHSYNETNSAGGGGGGSDYPGVLTITSNDANAATTTIPMAGWWQERSENENEPDLQTIVNLMAGWDTNINPSLINFLTESTASGSSPTYYGEEVVSAYWAEADSTQSVSVQQIAAYHTQGDTSGLNYYVQGSTTTHTVLGTGSDVGQTFFPLNSGGTAPATGSFTTTSNFGFEELNPNAYSDDAKNTGDDGGGHMIRFYPVRNATGNLIPNTYIMACDYPNGAAENFDFQDNVYLVQNIRPVISNSVSSPQTTGGAASPAAAAATQLANGVSLQWTPVIDTTLTGYNIYSSLSATTGYALLTTTPVTGDSYLDTTALPGETVYYRVAAVNSLGAGLGTQTSVLTSGTPSTNLQSLAVGETPAGSVTTITPNQAYTVVAGGPGITATTDGFQYLFDAQTGNFDVAVQVSSITAAGSFSTAGIMARDALNTTGANVYMSASPANYRFKYRTTDGGTENVTAGTTTSLGYPDVWVRLTRVGNVFSGYTSPNGVVWTLMGQETLSSFPTTCYLGLAVAANTTATTTTAQLASYGNTVTYTGPVGIPETYPAVSGQTVQESVLANDVDLTGTIVPSTFSITTPPNEGGTATFDPTTGLLSYTPAVGFVGTETLAYTVADSNSATSSPTTITFNVAGPGPIAVADSFTTVAGQLTQLNVLANDTDATSTLNPSTVVIATQPNSGATLSVNTSTGVITYLAPTSFSGTDTFTYTVSDYAGAISTPATVTVTVSAPAVTGLVTTPFTGTATSGTATTLSVLASDTDSTGSITPSSIAIVLEPNEGGKAKVNTNGTITYTPASSYVGVETFAYTVKDSNGVTSSATLVTMTVNAPVQGPVATNTSTGAIANGSLAVNVTSGVTSVAGLNLSTLAVGTSPKHGSVSVNTSTGIITYTPAGNFIGADSFTYTVSDNNGKKSNIANVNVNVGVNVGTAVGNDKSVSFTSATGAATTVTLSHGTVDVLFTGAGTLTVGKNGKATVSGSGLQIAGLELSGTTATSALSIGAKGTLDIGGITDASPIKTIAAPGAILSGTVNLSGVGALQFQQINGASITLGAGIPAGVSLTAGLVNNAAITSAVPIRTLKATAWSSTSTGASTITAPSIGTMNVTGVFAAALTLTGGGTALKSAQIGTLGSPTWNISGNVTSVTAGSVNATLQAAVTGTINTFTVRGGGLGASLTAGSARTIHVVGNIQNARLNFTSGGTSLSTLSITGAMNGTSLITAGSVTSITATSLSDDTILIGASSGTTLANATSSTVGGAKLNSLRLTAHGVTFSDTTLIVNTLTNASLGTVDTTTTGGIGLAATKSIVGVQNQTPFHLISNSIATTVFGDFEIDLV